MYGYFWDERRVFLILEFAPGVCVLPGSVLRATFSRKFIMFHFKFFHFICRQCELYKHLQRQPMGRFSEPKVANVSRGEMQEYSFWVHTDAFSLSLSLSLSLTHTTTPTYTTYMRTYTHIHTPLAYIVHQPVGRRVGLLPQKARYTSRYQTRKSSHWR